MTKLEQIKAYVQEYAETIAEVLDIEVTIVDEACMRVAGTGPYKNCIGEQVPDGSFFQEILKTGKPGIIAEHEKGAACQYCVTADQCQELITMGIPICKNDKTVGVIGLLAFTQKQKNKVASMSSKLLSFLNHMSALLESKLLLQDVNLQLEKKVEETTELINKSISFGGMLGQSAQFVNLVQQAKQVASSQSTVLIRGESGTGKELLARAVHTESNRHKRPFIVINCPSIPENLLESELFGYITGAFTGANREGKMGKFELAHQGTIFLDEIGDLPLTLQPKILRVMQEKTIERIGSNKPIQIDVRIIAATNKDLEKMVEEGSFREDLYYRLNVIPFYIPPLRERKEDIALYIKHFLHKYTTLLNKKISGVDAELLRWFQDYHWPGNIRQVENVIEFMVNMVDSEVLGINDLPFNLIKKQKMSSINQLGLNEYLEQYEKQILESYISKDSTLQQKKQAAQALKISLATLYRKLEKYNLI